MRSRFLVHGFRFQVPGSSYRRRSNRACDEPGTRTKEPGTVEPRGTWNERGTRNPTWNPEPGIGTVPNQVSSGVRERRSDACRSRQRATLDSVGVPDAPRSEFRIRPSFRISHSEFRTRVFRPPPDYRLDEALEAAGGSLVRPVWTGDIWMMVLRGDTSQRKRPRGGSSPIGPASGAAAAHDRNDRRGSRASTSRSTSGSSASSRRLVQLDPRLEKIQVGAGQDHADVDLLAALDPRHDPDDRVVVGVFSGHARPPRQTRRGARQPLQQVAEVCGRAAGGASADLVGQPRVRNRRRRSPSMHVGAHIRSSGRSSTSIEPTAHGAAARGP